MHNKIWPYVQFYSILFIFICLRWWWWSNGWPGQDINKEGPFYLHKIFVYFYDKYINFLRIIIKVTIIFLRNIHTFTPEWLGKKFRWQFFILDELLLSIYTFNRDQYTGFVSYVFYDAQFELFISLNDVNTEIYDFLLLFFYSSLHIECVCSVKIQVNRFFRYKLLSCPLFLLLNFIHKVWWIKVNESGFVV